jgi:LytS/YehU family sensor histidine kinase
MAVQGGSVVFHCANSRHDTRMEEKSGIGMGNVRRRLKLLYGSDFTLKIDETSDIYDILVVIPTVCKVITDNK